MTASFLNSIPPSDVETFLIGLGSLLPFDTVRALLDEVRRQHMDGAVFDKLLANRAHQPLCSNVRPSHMAVLRRCWNSKLGSREPPLKGPAPSVKDVLANAFAQQTPSEASATTIKRVHSQPRRRRALSQADLLKAMNDENGMCRSNSFAAPRIQSEMKKHFEPPQRRASAPAMKTQEDSICSQNSKVCAKDVIPEKVCRTRSKESSQEKTTHMNDQLVRTCSKQTLAGKMLPTRANSMRTAHDIHGPSKDMLGEFVTKARTTRSIFSEDSTPLPAAARGLKFRRPPQVPLLDLSCLIRIDGDGTKSKPPANAEQKAAVQNVEARHKRNGYRDVIPPGFLASNPDDQRRIASFYGYRTDGFAATMHNLRTDEIRPRLFLGTMADAAYWPLLKALAVSHILNCAVEAQKSKSPYEPHGIRYLLLPLHDTPETAQILCKGKFRALKEATKFIHASLKAKSQKGAIFVHCVQGLSRSAAVVCAYLMEYEGLSMDAAMGEVRSRHKGSLTSPHWQAMLHKFQDEVQVALSTGPFKF